MSPVDNAVIERTAKALYEHARSTAGAGISRNMKLWEQMEPPEKSEWITKGSVAAIAALDFNPSSTHWVILVANWGSVLLEGTMQEAEERRRQMAERENEVAHMRPATAAEVAGGRVSLCFNHPFFHRVRPFPCGCQECGK